MLGIEEERDEEILSVFKERTVQGGKQMYAYDYNAKNKIDKCQVFRQIETV